MKNKLILFLCSILFLSIFSVSADDFEINSLVIKYIVQEGNDLSAQLTLVNGDSAQKIISEPSSDFFSVSPRELYLNSYEPGTFDILFDSADKPTGVYVGHVNVIGEDNNVVVPVILGVKKGTSVGITSGTSFVKDISPGQEFSFDINLYNLQPYEPVTKLNLEYHIVDLDGKEILSDSESFDVKDTVHLTKKFILPSDIQPGDYISYTVVRKDSSTDVSAFLFSVSSVSLSPSINKNNSYFVISLVIIGILIFSFIILNYYWNRKLVSNASYWNNRVVTLKKVKFSDSTKELSKLEYQKQLLKAAFAKGYLKENSYKESLKKIDSLIDKIKKRL